MSLIAEISRLIVAALLPLVASAGGGEKEEKKEKGEGKQEKEKGEKEAKLLSLIKLTTVEGKGNFSLNCSALAKVCHPQVKRDEEFDKTIAKQLGDNLPADIFAKIDLEDTFINFYLSTVFLAKRELTSVMDSVFIAWPVPPPSGTYAWLRLARPPPSGTYAWLRLARPPPFFIILFLFLFLTHSRGLWGLKRSQNAPTGGSSVKR